MAFATTLLRSAFRISRVAALTAHAVRHFAYLPAAFHLDQVWEDRLSTTLMQQIRVEEFYVELRKRFDSTKTGSALDLEIFANKVRRAENVRQLVELLEALRLSDNANKFREGLSHATIRAHIQLGLYDQLLKILEDKVKYGLFLDQYTAALLVDKFMEMKRPHDCVRIAIDLMLQEDFSSPITRDLALLSCLTFLRSPDWALLAPLNITPEAPDTGEEVIIYVRTIKNPFFDDHFDTKTPQHLLGKTLFVAGGWRNDSIGTSARIVGLGLHEKWDQGLRLLENVSSSPDDAGVLRESFQSLVDALEAAPKTPEGQFVNPPPKVTEPMVPTPGIVVTPSLDPATLRTRLKQVEGQLNSKGKLKEGSLLDLTEKQTKDTIQSASAAEIDLQTALYQQWITRREKEVDRLVKRFEAEERLKELEAKRKALQEEEEMLFFFEKKNEWEKMLSLEARQAMAAAETTDGSKYDFRIQDPDYEINQIPEPVAYRKFRKHERHQVKYDETRKAWTVPPPRIVR